MKNFFKKIAGTYRGEESGFTLIELLIVIVILGVLAAAIIPNLSKFVGSGTVGAANAELASVRTAVGAYQADNDGRFPAASPTAGGLITNALIEGGSGYVQGTIRGDYTCSNTGLIISADNGVNGANSVTNPWPTSIQWSVDKWIKTP